MPERWLRGPTLAEDGVTATGSMHIVDLPDVDAVRVFAFEEPNYKAGAYAEVMVRRWHTLLGGTMWTHAVDTRDADRFLVIGHGALGIDVSSDGLPAAHWDFIDKHQYGDRLVVSGPLFIRRRLRLGRQRGRSRAGYPKHRRGDAGEPPARASRPLRSGRDSAESACAADPVTCPLAG
jgi:uncharacterized protein YciI